MLMDWNKQAEDVLKAWTTSQQKLWDSWIKTVQSFGTAQVSDTWEKSVDTWKDSVKRALDAQTAWSQFWADNITSGPGATKQTADWSKQLLEVNKRWADTQSQLWDSWFETIKKTDPATITQNWNLEEVQKLVQTWQEASQKALEAQMEWTKVWSAQAQNK